MVLRKRDRIAIDAGDIEKNFARASRHQRCEHGFGRGAVVGHQRADLAAGPAWADHAPRGQAAITHERAADMSPRADPRTQDARGAGNTVASSAATVANGTSASGMIPVGGAGRGATRPP